MSEHENILGSFIWLDYFTDVSKGNNVPNYIEFFINNGEVYISYDIDEKVMIGLGIDGWLNQVTYILTSVDSTITLNENFHKYVRK